MPKPEEVEKILARLVPAAWSEEGAAGLSGTIARLAGQDQKPAQVAKISALRTLRKRIATGGIAALFAIGGFAFWNHEVPRNKPVVSHHSATAEMVLLNTSERIETMSDEGWREAEDGSAMQAVRLRVMDVDNVLDGKTGIVMRISQPREELMLTPITSF
ncbi:MAG: hypothetical protein V4733_07055 [Verrucomicrobiota bacterium]